VNWSGFVGATVSITFFEDGRVVDLWIETLPECPFSLLIRLGCNVNDRVDQVGGQSYTLTREEDRLAEPVQAFNLAMIAHFFDDPLLPDPEPDEPFFDEDEPALDFADSPSALPDAASFSSLGSKGSVTNETNDVRRPPISFIADPAVEKIASTRKAVLASKLNFLNSSLTESFTWSLLMPNPVCGSRVWCAGGPGFPGVLMND
jgi:hypothetical protein